MGSRKSACLGMALAMVAGHVAAEGAQPATPAVSPSPSQAPNTAAPGKDDLDSILSTPNSPAAPAPAAELSGGAASTAPPTSVAPSAASAAAGSQPDLSPNDKAAADSGSASAEAGPAIAGSTALVDANPGETQAKGRGRNALIEEIVVTAQKREENIQSVPIAISAFNGKQLETLGVTNTKQLGLITPGLQFSEVAGFTLIYLRGVGTDSFLPYSDPSVATYVDGLYVPASQGLINALGGVERVEILKGPQGTLFGRNSTGGAINVITKSPGNDTEVSTQLSYGNFNDRRAQLYASAPLIDSLSASVSAIYSHATSYYKEVSDTACLACLPPEAPMPNDKTYGLRLKLHWAPTEYFDASLAGYRLLQTGSASTVSQLEHPSLLASTLGIQPETNPYQDDGNDSHLLSVDNTTFYGNAKLSLRPFDVKLIVGNQFIETKNAKYDYDGSPEDLVSFYTRDEYTRVFTGELQIVSNDTSWMADRFKWIGGVYFLHSVGGFDPIVLQVAGGSIPQIDQLLAGLPGLNQILDQVPGLELTPGPGVQIGVHGILKTDALSGYVQGTYDIIDKLSLTLGGRYQTENRFLTKAFTNLVDDQGGETRLFTWITPEVNQYNFSPKVSLNVKPIDGVLTYLSWSRAYKSGTYNGIAVYLPPTYVKPERLTAYELGLKSDFLDGQLRFNAAVFQDDIASPQVTYVSLTNGGAITFENAGSARIRGAEFDTIYEPLPNLDSGLVLTADASYLRSIFTDYPDASGYNEQTGLFFDKTGNFSGNRIPRSPRVSGTLGLNQTVDTDSGVWDGGANIYYNAGFYYTAQNTAQAHQGTYYLLNAQGGYLYKPWKTKLTLFGQNLNNRKYSYAEFTEDFGSFLSLAPPRTYGVRLNWDY